MSSVEERLEKLEKEVEQLKLGHVSAHGLSSKKQGWISRISGSFKNDSDFDEILRLGQEERQADQVVDE
jgi:hypothetical protein